MQKAESRIQNPESSPAAGGWGIQDAVNRGLLRLAPDAGQTAGETSLSADGGDEQGAGDRGQDSGTGQDPGQPGQPGQQPPPDPWSGEAPEFLREALGVERFEDLRGLHSRAALSDAQQELIQTLLDAQRGDGAPAAGTPAAAAPAEPKFDWYGFGSHAAYLAAYRANPEMAEQAKNKWLWSQGGPRAGAASEEKRRLESLEAGAFRAGWNADLQSIETKFPEAKNPAVSAGVNKFIQQHSGWLTELKKAYPLMNVVEFAFKASDYDRLAKVLAGQGARLHEVRAGAGTARTGVGGNQLPPRPTTHATAIERALERVRQAGGTVDAGMLEYARKMGARVA